MSRRPPGGRRRAPVIGPPGQSRRRWLVGFGVPLGLLLVIGGYLGWEARQAQQDIGAATSQVSQLEQQIREGDSAAAGQTLVLLQDSTASAVDHLSGPLWSVASRLPLVGDDVSAAQTASSSVDDIAQRGLPPLVDQTDALDPAVFRPTDGTLDVARIADIAPSIIQASEVLTANDRRLAAIDPDDLVGPLRAPITELIDQVDDASRTAGAAAKAARILPDMLGADGPRQYALMIQNNAEARSTGGILGTGALIEVRDGRISLGRQVSTGDFQPTDDPIVEPTPDEITSFTQVAFSDIRDANLTPDFPRTGRLVQAFFDRQLDEKIDGVVSIDPVALSYVLEGTGPVKLPGGDELSSTNAVETLLNTVYARFEDPAEQDAYFATASAAVFDAVVSGRGDPSRAFAGLRRATSENRVLVWSADADEQTVLASSGVGGSFPTDTDRPDVGVYVSDITSSKMQFYLQTGTRVRTAGCVDGRQRFDVTTTLRSKAPSDSALLPAYIVGRGNRAPLGSMQLQVFTFGPVDGEVGTLEVDGKRVFGTPARLGGRPGAKQVVLLGAGKTITIRTTMTSGPGQTGPILLSTTPGVDSAPNDVSIASTCD